MPVAAKPFTWISPIADFGAFSPTRAFGKEGEAMPYAPFNVVHKANGGGQAAVCGAKAMFRLAVLHGA